VSRNDALLASWNWLSSEFEKIDRRGDSGRRSACGILDGLVPSFSERVTCLAASMTLAPSSGWTAWWHRASAPQASRRRRGCVCRRVDGNGRVDPCRRKGCSGRLRRCRLRSDRVGALNQTRCRSVCDEEERGVVRMSATVRRPMLVCSTVERRLGRCSIRNSDSGFQCGLRTLS